MSIGLVSAPLGYETPPGAPPLKLASWYSILQELGRDTTVYDLELELFLKLHSEKDAYNYLNRFFGGIVFIPYMDVLSSEFLFQTSTEIPTLLTYSYCRDNEQLQSDLIQKKSRHLGIPSGLLSQWVETVLCVLDSFSKKIASHNTVFVNMPLPGSTTTGLILGKYIKDAAPDTTVVAAGTHINTPELAALGFAMNAIDFITFYDDEYTVRALSQGAPVKEVPNLSWRDDHGQLKKSNKTILEHDLDNLPIPDFSPFPISKYGLTASGTRIAVLETSRSCPFHCRFCSNNKFWNCVGDINSTYRCKSVERVREEIDAVLDTHTVNAVSFIDCTLNYNKNNRFAKLLTELKKVDLMYYGGMRVDQLIPSIIDSMAEAGFVAVILGIESFDEHCLRSYQKGSSAYVDHAFKMVPLLLKKGILPQINILIGTPSETPEDMERSMSMLTRFAEHLKKMHYPVFSINASITYLNYPSKMYFEFCEESGYTIVYHELPPELSESIPPHVKEAATAVPLKAVKSEGSSNGKDKNRYVPVLDKHTLFDTVYSLWSSDEEILTFELKALEKHFEKIVGTWLHEDILLQWTGNAVESSRSPQSLIGQVICALHNEKTVPFRRLLKMLHLTEEPLSSNALKSTWATLHYLWKKEMLRIRPSL